MNMFWGSEGIAPCYPFGKRLDFPRDCLDAVVKIEYPFLVPVENLTQVIQHIFRTATFNLTFSELLLNTYARKFQSPGPYDLA